MRIYDSLANLNIKEVFVHDCLEELSSGQHASFNKLLKDEPEEQIPILTISDGFLVMGVHYRYMAKTDTFTVSGHTALNYGSIENILAVEKTFVNAYDMVYGQFVSLVATMGIALKQDKSQMNFGYGRHIDGNGGLYFFSSNEYTPLRDDSNAVELLEEEIAFASVSLAGLYDMFRIIVQDEESYIAKVIYAHIGEKIGYSKELIDQFIDESATRKLSVDIAPLKKADGILGIKKDPDGKVGIH
jgi:hypothetical protein